MAGLKIAVTGAAGFLGTEVLRKLNEAGSHPVAIVRTPPGGGVPYDVRVAGDLATAPLEPLLAGCDAVVNLAARVHVVRRESPAEALRRHFAMNCDFPVRLANAARYAGLSRMVQLSSVAAIASNTPGFVADDGSPERPTTPYGKAKLAADRALAELSVPHMTIMSLRPPAIYGPGVGAFFAKLLGAARLGVPLPVGGYHNRRSFAYVDNVADAVVTALGSGLEGAFVITDSPPISTADLYRRLLAMYDHGDRVFDAPRGVITPLLRLALRDRAQSLVGDAAYDGSRFAAATGWRPRIAMDEALARTVRGRG